MATPVKVLVTGASGFLGSHICEALLKESYEVYGLVRRTTFERKLEGVSYISGNLLDQASLKKATKGMDCVIHTAALVTDYAPWSAFVDTNVVGIQNLCDALLVNGCKKLIHISTIDVYGLPAAGTTLNDDSPLKKSRYPYPDSKIAAEEIVEERLASKGIKISTIRPSWIFGEYDPIFFPELIRAVKSNGWIYIGSKKRRICLSYVKNVADACVYLLKNENEKPTKLLYNDYTITWEELMTSIATASGSKIPTLTLPFGVIKFVSILLEATWKLLRIKNRPLLTPFAVDFTGLDLDFQAKRISELGFIAAVNKSEAFRRTLDFFLTTRP